MPFDILRAIGIRGGIIFALVLLAGLCWYKWGVWKDKFGDLSDEASAVLVAVRDATGDRKLVWRDVPQQIDALDASLTDAKSALDTQSDRINQLGAESTRLRAENEALAAKVAKLNKKRDALIAQLEDDALEPGDRADCWAQIRETDDALNQLYREGF